MIPVPSARLTDNVCPSMGGGPVMPSVSCTTSRLWKNTTACWHTLFCWVGVGWAVTLPVLYVRSRHRDQSTWNQSNRRQKSYGPNKLLFPSSQPHYHLEQHLWTLIPCSQAKPSPPPPPRSRPLNGLFTSAWWLDWSVLAEKHWYRVDIDNRSLKFINSSCNSKIIYKIVLGICPLLHYLHYRIIKMFDTL